MGKKNKHLDVKDFFVDHNRIVVMAQSGRYAVGVKPCSNTADHQVWVELVDDVHNGIQDSKNARPILSYRDGKYRLRDMSRPIACELSGLPVKKQSEAIAARLPVNVHKLVCQIWAERHELFYAFCAATGYDPDLKPELAEMSGLMFSVAATA